MKNYSNKATPYATTALLLSALLTGCATGPISDDERQAYDGWWTAKIQKTPPSQTQNSWRMSCTNMEGEFSFQVVDGVVLMKVLGKEQEQELSSGGRFKIKQETDFHIDEGIGSDTNIDDGRVTYYIKGKLSGSNPKGSIQDFVQEIGAGCLTKIIYAREEA